jgi:RNA polymerase sigma factor (sigma-70 family)
MGKFTAGVLMRHIRRLVPGDPPEQGSDGDLLRRYATQRDEAAFAALVQRHGPMVWNACRRALRDHHDAEDVFQATFLVLAKKAGAIRWRDSVAGWLYAVALRLAAKARCQAARRPHPAAVEPAAPDPFEAMSARDLLAALDEEMAALPERFRGPAVLCWLEGRTQQEAARLLDVPYITLRRRLEHGKRLLHARLSRRGLALAAALTAPALADAVPAATLANAARGTAVTPRATALAESLLSSAAGKVRAALVLFLACLFATGVGLAAVSFPDQPARPGPQAAAPARQLPAQNAQRVDTLGDPLPPQVLVRLGSTRLRGESSQAVAFSPNGQWLASGGWDKHIRLWDPKTGKEVRTLLGPERGVSAVAFSADSKLLAGTGVDKVVYLWDPATGKEVGRLEGFPGDLKALAFAPKGNLLVTGDGESVRLWDAAEKRLLHTLEAQKADKACSNCFSVAFAPDGRAVAAASDNTVRVWNTDGKLLHHLKGHVGSISAVLFSRDDKHILTFGTQENNAWDSTTGKKLFALRGARVSGSCVAFSPDGKLLAFGGNDQEVRIWSWTERREIMQLPRHPDRIRCLAFSPDSKTLVYVADASPIHLWDPSTGWPKITLAGHRERLLSAVYTPDGRRIVTCAWDGTARLWDARTGQEIRQLDVGPGNEKVNPGRDVKTFGKVVVSPDGKLAAVARGDEVVVVCDLATGKEVRRYMGQCLAFSPDGRWIAVGTRSTSQKSYNVGEVRLYDRATGELKRQLRGHLTPVTGLEFSPDSQSLVSRGVVFFGLRSGEVGESETKHVRLWDVATGKQRRALAVDSYPNGLALAPAGRTAATTGLANNAVRLWETATGDPRGELAGHKGTVFDVAYSPDGRTVATASLDGTIRLWDAFSMKELGLLEGHRGWVLSVAFSPDGMRLLSGGLDTTALVWDVRRFTQRPVSAAAMKAADMEACWEDLGGGVPRAFRAMGKLLAAPADAAAFLGEHMKPAPAAEARHVAALIADLGSEQFKTRDRAMKELEKLGEVAAPALRKAYTGDPPLEIKRRLEVLLEKLTNWPAETLRQVRAVEVLEHVGTPAVRAVLERLVREGAPEARLTREAESALSRLRLSVGER